MAAAKAMKTVEVIIAWQFSGLVTLLGFLVLRWSFYPSHVALSLELELCYWSREQESDQL